MQRKATEIERDIAGQVRSLALSTECPELTPAQHAAQVREDVASLSDAEVIETARCTWEAIGR